MTSQSALLSHQFLVDPQGSNVHCSVSAQLKNPFVVTCQKNLASLSAGDSCFLVHASHVVLWIPEQHGRDLGIAKALQKSAASSGDKCHVINLPFRPFLFQLTV